MCQRHHTTHFILFIMNHMGHVISAAEDSGESAASDQALLFRAYSSDTVALGWMDDKQHRLIFWAWDLYHHQLKKRVVDVFRLMQMAKQFARVSYSVFTKWKKNKNIFCWVDAVIALLFFWYVRLQSELKGKLFEWVGSDLTGVGCNLIWALSGNERSGLVWPNTREGGLHYSMSEE